MISALIGGLALACLPFVTDSIAWPFVILAGWLWGVFCAKLGLP